MRIFSLFILLVIVNVSKAQTYGNEWIDYSQQYFNFPVYETGIHRINYSELNTSLSNNGILISTINTDNFQVFGRESEVFINVIDGGDNTMDPGDYIEFYADKNDGWLDGQLYDSLEAQPDKYYSLFNDTLQYYFTWNNTGNNNRILQETDVNYSAYTTINYCWKKNYVNYSNEYNEGPKYAGLSSPAYSLGEGYASSPYTLGQTKSTAVPTRNPYTGFGSPNSVITGISMGASSSESSHVNNHNHALQIKYGSGNTITFDTTYVGYQLINKKMEIPTTTIESPTTAVNHNSYSIGQLSDKQHLSSVSIIYPHTMDFENTNYFRFAVPFNTIESKSRLSISNFNGATPKLYVLNGDTLKTIPMINNAGIWEALVPNLSNNDSAQCLLVDSVNYNTVSNVSIVMGNGYFRDFSQIMPNDAYIIVTNQKLYNGALDYANYRGGIGGAHDTILVNVEELYHQFGGGVFKSPLGIRRFCNLAINTWPTYPSHLFLIGKSIRDVTEGNSIGSRKSNSAYQANLVPSFGYPSSDNHFTFSLGTSGNSYAIPTGRYSAMENSSVNDYLNKVIEYEEQQNPFGLYDIPNKEWQKQVLHFGGGGSQTEINLLNYHLSQFKQKIEDTLFGGNVSSYSKGNSSSLNSNDFFEVQQKLQEGVSLITFFSHASSSGGFGQNIDSPNNWGNNGKYPMVIGLGCYTGDVHQPGGNSYSENIVNPVGQGAISFLSTVKLGFVSEIARYTNVYYHQIGKKNYGRDIGFCMKSTADSLTLVSNLDILFHGNVLGMALQGDPALKLNTHLAPEIVLSTNRIWTSPPSIDLSVDTFDLNIVLTNIGSAFIDTFELSIQRFFPNGNDSTYFVKVPGLLFRDTIRYKMASNHPIAVGLNNFTIKADLPFSIIDEHFDETTNNQISFSTYISSNDLIPIWPYEYAIIPSDTITCKASTINPFAATNQYIFEIDTTDLFNSSFKKHQLIISAGGVIEAMPNDWINSSSLVSDPITFADSTVYFWRCSPDSVTKSWQESSFQYIPNKWGWGQSHFFQFKNNDYTNLLYNRPTRTFDFQSSVTQVSCNSFVNNGYYPASGWGGTRWSLGGALVDYGGYGTLPAIHIAVIDPITLQNWGTPHYDGNGNPINTQHCYGQFNGHPSLCSGATSWRNRSEGMFIFQMGNSVQMDSLVSMLNNKIPTGHYVLAYTYITDSYTNPTNLYASWPADLFSAFQNLGATSFTQGMDDDGFIFFCQKGNSASVQEIHTADALSGAPGDTEEELIFEALIQGSSTSGLVKGEIAGPTFNWNTLYWAQNPQEVGTNDTTRLLVYGIDTLGNETLKIDTLMTPYDSIVNLNSIIDAAEFPFLRLNALTIDSVAITPAQFNRWQIVYEPVPECAINPKKGFYYSINNDTIQEGDSAKFAIAIENISAFDMDSLLVHYWIEDLSHSKNHMSYSRQDSLKSGEFIFDTISFSSKNYPGINSVWTAANPKINGDKQDQLEQFYFNNLAQKTFNVIEDNTNPILDVTFDGIHILDEDIVSPIPLISISLDDENEFLLLNEDIDTNLLKVQLIRPNSNTPEQLFFSNNGESGYLMWEPAIDEKNLFKIEYNPTFTVDGIYTLMVQGRDKSNNFSGDFSYEISFEVITASTITHLFNYPNPFSTKTHFVFTLTGSKIPDEMLIQIMTITGKVVREISLDEIGPLNIGNNKTDFFWDGRDQFGDQLANGVYLYRALVKINGENIDHRGTSADAKSFKKEFGKMYLMH
mgnify:CR=1 FL=1